MPLKINIADEWKCEQTMKGGFERALEYVLSGEQLLWKEWETAPHTSLTVDKIPWDTKGSHQFFLADVGILSQLLCKICQNKICLCKWSEMWWNIIQYIYKLAHKTLRKSLWEPKLDLQKWFLAILSILHIFESFSHKHGPLFSNAK